MFWVAVVAAGVIALILMFRWLSKKRLSAPVQMRTGEQIRIILPQKAAQQPAESGPVQSIRRHYRRYLKRCVKEGLSLRRDTTTADVLNQVQAHRELAHNARPVRELYIRARYAGSATGEDAKKMARLCTKPGKK